MVKDPNAKEPYQQPPTPVPKGRDLYIALPAVFGFIILCVCGGFIFNRKRRQIGLGNIMGRRKGYGVGKSRRQRLGLGRKSGAIQLREQELTAEGQYRDTPVEQHARVPEHRRNDSDGLGSLVGTPTEEGPSGGNIFRDEMRRQERERH
jgi:Ykl077w/Psg1 (Pma1 Stabilization in Golgi)